MQAATDLKGAKRTPFGALSNQLRLDIIAALLGGAKNVSALTRAVGRSQALVSHGLKKLSEAGFVYARPQGRSRVYALNDEFTAPFLSAIGFDAGKASVQQGLLRTVLEHAPVSFAVTDMHGVFTFICGEMVTKHKVPDAAFIGRSIHDLFYEDRKNIVEHIGRALTGETVRWTTSSSGYTYEVLSVPFHGADGRVAGVLNIAREIERKQAAERETDWKAMAEGTPYTLLQIDTTYRIQAINRMQRKTPVIGLSLLDLLPEESRSTAKEAIDRSLATGEMTEYVVRAMITPKEPEGRWYHSRVSPFLVDGRVAGAVIAGHEVPRPPERG